MLKMVSVQEDVLLDTLVIHAMTHVMVFAHMTVAQIVKGNTAIACNQREVAREDVFLAGLGVTADGNVLKEHMVRSVLKIADTASIMVRNKAVRLTLGLVEVECAQKATCCQHVRHTVLSK